MWRAYKLKEDALDKMGLEDKEAEDKEADKDKGCFRGWRGTMGMARQELAHELVIGGVPSRKVTSSHFPRATVEELRVVL